MGKGYIAEPLVLLRNCCNAMKTIKILYVLLFCVGLVACKSDHDSLIRLLQRKEVSLREVEVLWLNTACGAATERELRETKYVISLTNHAFVMFVQEMLENRCVQRESRNHPLTFDEIVLRIIDSNNFQYFVYISQRYDDKNGRFYEVSSGVAGTSSKNSTTRYVLFPTQGS
jgi:hypothetical protein